MNWRLLFIWPLLATTSLHAQQKGKAIVTSADKTIIPEGIAIDPRSGDVYVSSINQHKILRIAKNGKAADFISSGVHGFLEGLGMKIDTDRNWLWAVSNKKENGIYTSQLQSFDLKTGEEKQRYQIQDTTPHIFNDLVILDSVLYITDTYSSALYQLDTRKPELRLYKKHADLSYPNGITADPGTHRLYIASYKNGLVMLDVNTGETSILKGDVNKTRVRGLDGIIFYRNNLIGVYNLEDRKQHAVLQYRLSTDGKSIQTEKIIDEGNPSFYEPTTVAVYRNKLYVIANSHLAVYNQNKESTIGVEDKLTAPAIVVYKLKM
jgi:DNA-binding beta-propeller fold protein YncE